MKAEEREREQKTFFSGNTTPEETLASDVSKSFSSNLGPAYIGQEKNSLLISGRFCFKKNFFHVNLIGRSSQ